MEISLDVRWNQGSPDCATATEPTFQVHAADEDTFILRQSKCSSFEAPFLYLLFGTDKALLLDTGAEPGPGQPFPLREVVQGIVAEWSVRHGRPAMELIVAHTHGHDDHIFGDSEFAGQPRTTVVPSALADVTAFFGLADWPRRNAVFDLGGRPLTLIPTPGHEPSHVAVYDDRTRILVTGDVFYPGFLYVRDWAAYRESIERLSRFAADHPVGLLLGCHIEMTRTAGFAYPSGTTFQPEEHRLELRLTHLEELRAALGSLGDTPVRRVFDDFILQPVAGE